MYIPVASCLIKCFSNAIAVVAHYIIIIPSNSFLLSMALYTQSIYIHISTLSLYNITIAICMYIIANVYTYIVMMKYHGWVFKPFIIIAMYMYVCCKLLAENNYY